MVSCATPCAEQCFYSENKTLRILAVCSHSSLTTTTKSLQLLCLYTKTSRNNVPNLIGCVPKVQTKVRAQGVIFMHVSHYVACGSHFHPGVGLHAALPPPAMGVDDGLFALHHRVISAAFLLRCTR